MIMKNIAFASVLCIFLVSFISIFTYSGFGYNENNKVSHYYLENSLEHTGSANVVSAIVWDFRGFDTMGEETVLFTVLVGVFTVISLKAGEV
ncbi:MAG: hypothetical protein JW716_02285 [Candidatus Aenigmarchaeota archaeon]|nr:hypothetical protein [Candidatus Aenigmarchaeota archaeon]